MMAGQLGLMMMATNPHAEVTAKILAELKAGVAPWAKPWAAVKGGAPVGIPHNGKSGRPYSGANVFLLWMAMHGNPTWWERPAFVTFKQALDAGGHVRKGEKGNAVYYMGEITRRDERDGDEDGEGRSVRFLKRYTVFHVSQCEGLSGKLAEPATLTVEPLLRSDLAEFYDTVGALTRHGGNQAFYAPGPDLIMLPALGQFAGEAEYHATRLHELTHWTGGTTRLNRLPLGAKYRSNAYAFEELVAELGAALLCAELGVEGQLRHADYIGGWIKLLSDHERAFFSAASQASKAVEYLRGLCLAERDQLAVAA